MFAHQPVVADVIARLLHQIDALLHVGAGRENLAGGGENRDAHVVAVADRVEHAHQLLARLLVLRIHRRAVDGDRGDIIGDVEADRFEIHCGSPESVMMSASTATPPRGSAMNGLISALVKFACAAAKRDIATSASASASRSAGGRPRAPTSSG
jgi:hypothetical protein